MNLIKTARKFVDTAGFDRRYVRESLLLSDGSAELKLTNGFAGQDLSGAPRHTTRVYYTYHNAKPAQITDISLDFSDYQRKISVSGASHDQVNALTGLLSSKAKRLEHGFGGIGDRLIGALALLILGGVLTGLAPAPIFASNVVKFCIFAAGLAVELSIWIFPWG